MPTVERFGSWMTFSFCKWALLPCAGSLAETEIPKALCSKERIYRACVAETGIPKALCSKERISRACVVIGWERLIADWRLVHMPGIPYGVGIGWVKSIVGWVGLLIGWRGRRWQVGCRWIVARRRHRLLKLDWSCTRGQREALLSLGIFVAIHLWTSGPSPFTLWCNPHTLLFLHLTSRFMFSVLSNLFWSFWNFQGGNRCDIGHIWVGSDTP